MNGHEKQIPVSRKTPIELRIQAEDICNEIDMIMKKEKLGRKKIDNLVFITSEKTSELISA